MRPAQTITSTEEHSLHSGRFSTILIQRVPRRMRYHQYTPCLQRLKQGSRLKSYRKYYIQIRTNQRTSCDQTIRQFIYTEHIVPITQINHMSPRCYIHSNHTPLIHTASRGRGFSKRERGGRSQFRSGLTRSTQFFLLRQGICQKCLSVAAHHPLRQ